MNTRIGKIKNSDGSIDFIFKVTAATGMEHDILDGLNDGDDREVCFSLPDREPNGADNDGNPIIYGIGGGSAAPDRDDWRDVREELQRWFDILSDCPTWKDVSKIRNEIRDIIRELLPPPPSSGKGGE